MDTDHLPPSLVFAVSLLLFSYFSLAQNSATSPASAFKIAMPLQKARYLLRWSKYACIIAVALSGLVIVNGLGAVGWWPLSLFSLGLLLALGAIDRLTAIVALRVPALAGRLCLPLVRVLSIHLDQGANTTGGTLARGESLDNNHLERLSGREEPVITEAELVSLDQRDREMLRSILRLDVTTAREIMVPRLDMMAVECSSSLVQVAEQMAQGGHSRIPVYEESLDHIVGIVHTREVLAALTSSEPERSLRDLLNPAFFIPETKRLDELLEELQDKGVQMAIVVDEYGGTEGLVTLEDLLEEIVGEIEDEFSRTRESQLVHLPDGGVLVDAGVSTEDIEDLFSTRIESPDVDTVGGYVYQALGKIPSAGDVVETDHLRIEVVSILGRRLRKLRINRTEGQSSTRTN